MTSARSIPGSGRSTVAIRKLSQAPLRRPTSSFLAATILSMSRFFPSVPMTTRVLPTGSAAASTEGLTPVTAAISAERSVAAWATTGASAGSLTIAAAWPSTTRGNPPTTDAETSGLGPSLSDAATAGPQRTAASTAKTKPNVRASMANLFRSIRRF